MTISKAICINYQTAFASELDVVALISSSVASFFASLSSFASSSFFASLSSFASSSFFLVSSFFQLLNAVSLAF